MKSPKHLVIALSCVLFLIPSSTLGQTEPAQLPSSEAGQRVDAYIKAFNSGDEQKIRAFISANVADEAIKRRSIDERINVFREMHSNMKTIALHKVLDSNSSSITGLFRTANNQWFEIGFMFESEPPHKLLGLRVEDTDPPTDIRTPASAVTGPPSALTERALVSSLEKRLEQIVQADEFSGTVLVARNGSPIFQRAYGLASKEFNVANRIDTKFNLGSINKLFTQIAIGQLVEQGKLSYDDLIAKYLPDYPNRDAANKVTIRQLLNMSSGIGDFFGEQFDGTPKERLKALKDFLPFFATKPLAFEPGTKQKYSNGGYIVLGLIIEQVSGQSYFDYVRDHIFRIAGMESTDSYETDAVISNLAEGYTREGSGGGARRSNIYSRPARGTSAGGGYSTAGDLLKLALAIQNGKLRNANFRNSTEVNKGIGIAGGAPGINAVLESSPANGIVIIVMSNYDPPSAETISKEIRQMVTGLK